MKMKTKTEETKMEEQIEPLDARKGRPRLRKKKVGKVDFGAVCVEEEHRSYLVRQRSNRVSEEAPLGENALAKLVVETAFQVHTGLGPGLLESVYEVVMAHELRQLGLSVARQVPIPIVYKGIKFEEGFKADLIVGKCLIVELKSVECLNLVHAKQLLTQLRLTRKKLGLLINFGGAHLKDNVRRIANGLNEPLPVL